MRPPLSSSSALENIWNSFEVGWCRVTSTILLWAIERMISITCSLSFELRPLVGSSKRNTSALDTISRPMFRRLRSPPESVFFTALPTMLSRRSLRPSSVSLPSMRRARSRRETHVFLDRQVVVERIILRDVAHEPLEVLDVGIERLAVEQDLSLARLEL